MSSQLGMFKSNSLQIEIDKDSLINNPTPPHLVVGSFHAKRPDFSKCPSSTLLKPAQNAPQCSMA